MATTKPQDEYTLVEHLAELRTRIINSMIAVTVFSIGAWNFSEFFFDIIRRPILPYLPQGGLVFTAPTDKFMAHLKIAILVGVIMSCPVWIYQVWMFVAPGLYRNERRFAFYFMTSGTVLFLTGVSFVYFLVYPIAFEYLLTFGGTTDSAMITIGDYLSFFFTTTLVFGLAFELPLILTLLGIAGIVSADFLRAARRYALVVICIVSAVLTPPDVLSMLLLAGPLMGLYEISIILIQLVGKKPESL